MIFLHELLNAPLEVPAFSKELPQEKLRNRAEVEKGASLTPQSALKWWGNPRNKRDLQFPAGVSYADDIRACGHEPKTVPIICFHRNTVSCRVFRDAHALGAKVPGIISRRDTTA